MKKLADITSSFEGQKMFQIMARAKELEAQGKDVLHFEIGDPDFDTPHEIIEEAYKAMLSGETHYTNSDGLIDFKRAIAYDIKKEYGFLPDLNQILVTNGANPLIYLAIKCLVNPGEEVLIPDPGFCSYFSAAKACSAQIVRVPLREENNFRIDPKDIAERVTDKTRLIIINSPNNPTGSVISKENVQKIAGIVRERDIYLLSDEVYKKINVGEEHTSPGTMDLCKERTIIINGFSKSHAMTGWRLGYAIGPKEVISKMGVLFESISSCVTPFIQRAAIKAFLDINQSVKKMKDVLDERKKALVEGLNSLPGVKCQMPDGAFYVFPNIKATGLTSEEFANFLLEKCGIAISPGNIFGEYGEGYVRFCYANNVADIKKAIERIRYALKQRQSAISKTYY